MKILSTTPMEHPCHPYLESTIVLSDDSILHGVEGQPPREVTHGSVM